MDRQLRSIQRMKISNLLKTLDIFAERVGHSPNRHEHKQDQSLSDTKHLADFMVCYTSGPTL